MSDLGLRAAVHAVLVGDSGLAAAVSGVFEAVPEGTAEPYLTVAATLDRVEGGARLHAVEVAAWSAHAGDKEATAIGGLVVALLDGRVAAVEGGAEAAFALEATRRETDARRGLRAVVHRFVARVSAPSPLTLTGPALLAPWSARGLQHRLEPVARGEVWRDANGTARFAGLEGHRKYRLTLAGGDIAPPAFAALWRGQAVTVGAATALSVQVPAGTDAVVLERTPVAGSVTAAADDGAAHAVTEVSGATVTLAAHPGFAVWVRYRPVLEMLVAGWSSALDEWRAGVPWEIELVEV